MEKTMTDWLAGQAEAMDRKVEGRNRNGEPVRAVVMARSYPTNIDDLWQAITDPGRIRRWLLPVSGDLRLGGTYQLQGNAGGVIERCAPPRLLSVTWVFGGNTSWVDVTLEADGEDSTRLVLEHIAREDDAGLAFWEQFGPGAVGVGWDLGLLSLVNHVGGAEPMAREEELIRSAEGRAFVAASSEAWRKANVAFGTPENAAREAALRTTAFYTGKSADTGA
jgi:uncharacterized protein YndB with AHSA1/START domain